MAILLSAHIHLLPSYGTIGVMKDHRIRLTNDDLSIITAALRARHSMARGTRRQRILELLDRLQDVGSGNPRMRFAARCMHGTFAVGTCPQCVAHTRRSLELASREGQPTSPSDTGAVGLARQQLPAWLSGREQSEWLP